jgi:hypothetical protein
MLFFQNLKPRYLSFIGFVTFDLVAFTLKPKFFSIHFVILAIPERKYFAIKKMLWELPHSILKYKKSPKELFFR